MPVASAPKQYICPGEPAGHFITSSVHLARLAAGFEACKQCPYRHDKRAVGREPASDSAPTKPFRRNLDDLFQVDGIRGTYLNEIDRTCAVRIASAFAAALWDRTPFAGANDGIDCGARAARPTVVVGYDERPFSPTIFSAVLDGLAGMGCHVVDVGRTTTPCFRFAVNHLHATGGLFVTGSGCEPSGTGFEATIERGQPLSLGSGLEVIRDAAAADGPSVSRPTRTAGTYRRLGASAAYRASLDSEFIVQRPMSVVIACASSIAQEILGELLKERGTAVATVPVSRRVRNPVHRRDADLLRLSVAVREQKADLGILIDEDAQRVGFVDDRGRQVPPAAISRFIVPRLLADKSHSVALLEPIALAELRPLLEAMGSRCLPAPTTAGAAVAAMCGMPALYCGGDCGRHWFLTAEGAATCDALVVLAKILAAASEASIPPSELIAA